MKCSEILTVLEQQSPLSLACSWDNPGLLVGDPAQEIRRVYIALDATDEVIRAAVSCKADLLLTHHPLIFSPVKQIRMDDFIGRRLLMLAENKISYIAMHTNFDIGVMGKLAADKLGLTGQEVLDVTAETAEGAAGIGRCGNLTKQMALRQCAQFVRDTFGLEQVSVFGDAERVISRAAVCPGSGKSEVQQAVLQNADVLITGDIDHHTGIDAVAQGLCIIDAGHYGLEHIFIGYMQEYLQNHTKDLEISVPGKEFPFWVI